ncbi:quinolinate synthase NadA [Natronogracilivirga saccharolytica]|uniref:Quinolinate synthase n=1 Tax=Natronogracilivirga saccharolytica TaxID=2812953 RepID=A0A8J7RM30_9BACT|nr:quinolinate synthase NadA [Natronogracilivirga saccharolytica]MBP3192214.1 quinolinate synthase NadA [Natronogracilivirga saccharolytica]
MSDYTTVPQNAQQTLEQLKNKLKGIVPETELVIKAEIAYEINRLKREKNAVILGHNYMEPALFYSIPDHVGDSLGLARIAAETDAERIVFCGVRFMAETAKILNPERMVLLPARVAGCSLAESITAEDVKKLKEKYPGVPVVTYINTYADVKAETDVCCTSSNAADIVRKLDSDSVICLPDEFLAKNIARETGKNVIYPGSERTGNDDMVIWDGRCEVHDKFTVEDIENARRQFPDTVVVAHPECPPEVVQAADYSGSTTAMTRFVRESDAERFLILTECAMGDNIAAENPEKEMLRMCSIRCPHMNEITLQDTLVSLREDKYQIEVPEDIRLRAKRSLDRMLELS